MIPEVDHYYWIRLYHDNAAWQVGLRAESRKCTTAEYCWFVLDGAPEDADLEYYDTEVNEVGPEIVPPPQ